MTGISLNEDVSLGVTVPSRHARGRAARVGPTLDTILANHGHVLLISQADIIAGVAKDYNIQGMANHGHIVSLTPGDFAQLALGNPVQKESSFLQAHTHTVIMACLL